LSAAARKQAKAKNDAFSAQRRCHVRELLQRASDTGTLPHAGEAKTTGFRGRGAGTASDCILAYSSSGED
jgi:hypothetical protein